MPRYFFHLFDNITSLDDEGVELVDAKSAIDRGIAHARYMAAQSVLNGHLILNHRIEVADTDDRRIATVFFRDVVEVHPTD